LSQATL